MSSVICFDGAKYEVYGDGCCILSYLSEFCGCFVVLSVILTSDGKRYRVTGISSSEFLEGGSASKISFDKSSEVTGVPVSFIGYCRSTFILPPRVKRVTGSNTTNFPKIDSEKGFQQFVSTSGSRVIMNHFPLEAAYQHSRRQRFIIRETVRFVGRYSFYMNESIASVVFPSSVEYIRKFSFYKCKNLRFILFKKDSKLKKIGYLSFCSTSLESVDIPSSVEVIGNFSFNGCENLRSVTFHEDSKLKRIGVWSFCSTSLKSVDIPSIVEEIGAYAFRDCKEFRSVRYLNETNIQIIGDGAFSNCNNLAH